MLGKSRCSKIWVHLFLWSLNPSFPPIPTLWPPSCPNSLSTHLFLFLGLFVPECQRMVLRHSSFLFPFNQKWVKGEFSDRSEPQESSHRKSISKKAVNWPTRVTCWLLASLRGGRGCGKKTDCRAGRRVQIPALPLSSCVAQPVSFPLWALLSPADNKGQTRGSSDTLNFQFYSNYMSQEG